MNDDPERDWGPLSLAIGNNIDLSSFLSCGMAMVQGMTNLAETLTPFMRDIQVRMVNFEIEMGRSKWRDSLFVEDAPRSEEVKPSSAREFLAQKQQRVARRQAEARRGRVKPWEDAGKRFR